MPRTVTVPVVIGEDYTQRLKERLEEYGIRPGELAAACEPPLAPSQISRWFHTNMVPSMRNVQRIEEAIVRIREEQRRAKRRKKNERSWLRAG